MGKEQKLVQRSQSTAVHVANELERYCRQRNKIVQQDVGGGQEP